MVDKPLPIAASVIATSGAANSKYNTEANKLTTPAAITALTNFLLNTASNANMIIATARNIEIIINSIYLPVFSSVRTVSELLFSFWTLIIGLSDNLSITVRRVRGIPI